VTGGTTIGDNTIIGAGAVVALDIPSGVFAAGVPARVIRKLESPEGTV
jgi:maltose O-acetyltransferase